MTDRRRDLLVLGASGRLGRLLRTVWPPDFAVRWHARTPAQGFVACDLLEDPARLFALARDAGCILCLAGATDRAVRQGRAAYEDNVTLACLAVEAAAKSGGTRVLLASSAAVYGRSIGYLTENVPGVSLSPYGVAKRAMEEKAATAARRQGVTLSSLRIGNVAGADAILGGWTPGFQLDSFDDGRTPRRSYIGPQSLGKVIRTLVETPDLPEIVNVAAPGVVEMGALLDAAVLGWTARTPTDAALRDVHMSTEVLQRIAPLSAACGTPESLVQEWRMAQPSPAEV